jgi:amidase
VANAPEGPLAGLTFAVKDIFDVAGYVTGCGNPETQAESAPATAHAPVVAALLAAGARFAGKTKTAEFAFSIDGRNDHDGTPLNPAAPGRVPGGSSSGSASAVAAGVVDFALGSDTGGSVRGPAAWCGIIGLRTTYGRVEIGGTMPLAQSFDTVGWFTRDPATYARVGAVLLGEDVEGPPLTRMALVEDAFALLDGAAERAALQAPVERVRRVLAEDAPITAAPEGLGQWQNLYRTIQCYEAWQAHGPWITRRKPKLNPAVARRFAVASRVTEAEYREGRARKLEVMRRVLDLAGEDEFERVRTAAISMLCIAGLAGLPQISLPLATVDGCPFGLSLVGPPGRDRALIDLAARVMAG